MWDKVRACRLLCIQYQIKDNVGGDSTLGFTERKYKHIVIKSSEKNNDRVWAHEIAHALLHTGKDLRNKEGAEFRGMVELEADTVSFFVMSAIGKEDKNTYKNYVRSFMSLLPEDKLNSDYINQRMEKLKNTAKLILKAGGYKYGEY